VTTAIDTNVIAALWGDDRQLNQTARTALDAAAGSGELVVSAPVFAELIAGPEITEDFVSGFCTRMGIVVEWQISENVWREAGRAFGSYAQRRRSKDLHPRRILADFLIGAHALSNGYALLTMDKSVYRAAFPTLKLLTF